MIQPPKISPAGLVSAGIATVRSESSPRGPGLPLIVMTLSFCYDASIMTDILLRHDSDHIATLTLNRPAARNALSMALMEALDGELQAIAEVQSIRVVILAGAGPAFCAGHDLRELRATPTRAFYEATFALCSRLMQRIVHLPKPVIAQVHGVATAAGCQLVASADLAVAADTARFATPGVISGCSAPPPWSRCRAISAANRPWRCC